MGAGDVVDQLVLVAALDGHAGSELGEIGKTHGLQSSSENRLYLR